MGFLDTQFFITFQERQVIHDNSVFCVAYRVVCNTKVYLNFAING
jgi:hypothetical protein